MLMLKWSLIHITTNVQANAMIKTFEEVQPIYGAFDTETDGLHIIHSKPFVFQFGFLDLPNNRGYAYAVDMVAQPQLATAVITRWHVLAKRLKKYMGHNVKFDLHMLINNKTPYEYEDNLTDTMFWIRYGHDQLVEKSGGPPLGLKDYSARYIDFEAKQHENLLSLEKSRLVKQYNAELAQALRSCGRPPAHYEAKSYTLSVLAKMFKDPTIDITDLPEKIKEPYLSWLASLPLAIQRNMTTGLVTKDDIPYTMLNRDNLIRYSLYDIVYTLETFLYTKKLVEARENQIGVEFEEKLIFPLLEMERVGFKADKEYLEKCRVLMKEYITDRRNKLYQLAGQRVNIGQHETIKEILFNEFNVEVASTADENISLVKSELQRNDKDNPVIEFISLIQELRTLEKWYSTYIVRFINQLKYSDRLYTTINQVGTVSGRVTSDFQQFPKEPIVTDKGAELFHPRKLIGTTGGDYIGICYLDYSQIELRFQALYTILVGHPDLNLCRAYMPYECVNPKGELFDVNNINHIKSWNSEWFYKEEPTKHWIPTDVHGATTKAAFHITEDDPHYKALRYVGKRVNFAKNYGAQRGKIRQMFPNYSEQEITDIDDAYYKAFPGVKEYHNYCYMRAQNFSQTTNLFGVKYYGVSGHKLINMMIQGSSAYYLKWKIRQLYEYTKANKIKSRWQMQIHDELSWEVHKDDDPRVFFEFKRIMEDWDDAMVPVVADMEITTGTWSEKEEVSNLDELQVYLSTRSIG